MHQDRNAKPPKHQREPGEEIGGLSRAVVAGKDQRAEWRLGCTQMLNSSGRCAIACGDMSDRRRPSVQRDDNSTKFEIGHAAIEHGGKQILNSG
jgi:hypothetical protein